MIMKYKLMTWAASICCGAILLLPVSALSAQEVKIGQDDTSVTGTLLTLDPSTSQYKIRAQWPITRMTQWIKVLNSFKTTPEQEFYNPVLAKDPSVVTFVQTNPDQISGETVYLSEHGTILRVKKTPVDTNLEKAAEFYKFLNKEIDNNNAEYSTEHKALNLNNNGIVVVYRGSSTLGNPTWEVTDQEKVNLYLSYISKLKAIPVKRSQAQTMSKMDDDFTGLNVFLVYTNYPGAYGKMLIITKDGRARWTKILQTVHTYPDTEHFYEAFREQAYEVIRNNEEAEKRKLQSELENNF
ncbi:MAG TPA: hypothetical protein PKI93_07030 [Alphaproteobacteria bacterium]|nr:hypothetical protein [Alphaproteobacteria bacterium]HNS45453.1 hypothetical protein [Alphaproteobacteria bacterium]